MSSRTEKNSAKYNLRKKYRKKAQDDSSSSSDHSSDEETIYSTATDDSATESTEYITDEEEPASKNKNAKDLQNLLAKMFPSAYMNAKTAKENVDKSSEASNGKSKKKASKSSSREEKATSKTSPKRRSKREELDDSDNSDIDIHSSEGSESSESERDDSDAEDIRPTSKKHAKAKNNKKINIIFTIGKKGNRPADDADEDEDDEYDDMYSDEDSYLESDDEEQCNSEDEEAFMKETYEKVEPVKPEPTASKVDAVNEQSKPAASSSDKGSSKKSDKKKNASTSVSEETKDVKKIPDMPEDVESEYLELVDLKKRLSKELALRPTNKILKRSVQECTDSIRELIKKARRENTRKYRKLIYEDTRPMNEMEYFKRKMSHKEQKKAMDDLNEINSHIYTEKPYRLSLLQSKMPAKCKAIAMQKLNVLKTMDPSDSEYYKIKNWVDTFMKIPFGIYKSVSVSMADGLEKSNEFLVAAKQTLDNCTYGLNDAKMQIMQMLGQWMVNPTSVGTAIAIHGPMGTGKTTLVKEGISKILGREFTFIALGGSGDSSFLEGHSYTYEGSTWGKIVQILIDSKCMNPVIYFDELDKVSDTPRGQEIIGILTHLIDTSQNTQFHDKYFSEVDFDLSKCLFIFSYNDENLVNPILRDRMYHIRTKGYDAKDKVSIARNYLLPKIREQVCFSEEDVVISDEMLRYVISTFTKNESGVRNLKRCLEIIYSKLNLFRLVSPENKMFVKDMNLEISFPITITKKEVDVFIKNDEVISQSMLAMYV
jgi:ATP-dependent Lon protease